MSWQAMSFGEGYERSGCESNTIAVEALFEKYAACGFLYPAKVARLRPYWPRIVSNWRLSLAGRGRTPIHRVAVYEDRAEGSWASLSSWTTGADHVHAQHLVSVGRPDATRAVLLATQSQLANDGAQAIGNWFRPENRFPARVFGSSPQTLGADLAAGRPMALLALPRSTARTIAADVPVHRCTPAHAPVLDTLARELCGPVQAAADGWRTGDLDLDAVDARYQEVGLRRYRRCFLAFDRGESHPTGFAVAWRGPLGLNFSFLENRLELHLDPTLDDAARLSTARSLVAAAAPAYDDFELPSLLLATDPVTSGALELAGAAPIVRYSQVTWLWPGFRRWFDHVESFYARLKAAHARRPALAVAS